MMMGAVDFLLKNNLLRSGIYIATSLLLLFLYSLDDSLTILMSAGDFNAFLKSDSIDLFMTSVYDNMKPILENLYVQYLWLMGLAVINLLAFLKLVNFWKEINMPYALNFFNPIRKYEWQDKNVKTSHDRFIKTTENSIIYKNPVAVDLEKYEISKNEIMQYLNMPMEYELSIEPTGRKGVQLRFFVLPKLFTLSSEIYEEGYIIYGIGADGLHRIQLDKQIHTICVGESGSGKSNTMHHLLQSIWINQKNIDHVNLVDLKGPELYRYRDRRNTSFIDKAESVRDLLRTLKYEMNRRFEGMKKHNNQNYQGNFIFTFIDEIGTVGTLPNKKLRDEIFALMIELFQKGRAAKIIFFIFAQKIDSSNIPSNVLANIPTKILMKTDSDFNINNTIGTKESLEKITRLDPDEFPRGRAVLKDGESSEKVLMQMPFIDLQNNS